MSAAPGHAPDALSVFFHPRGIAVIGASRDPTRLGFGLVRNLTRTRVAPVYFVHPAGAEWEGQQAYPSLAAIPAPIDLAIILLAAHRVPDVVRQCGRIGVRAVVVESGGFRETGAAGQALERDLLDAAQAYGIRVLGPNCIGLIDTNSGLNTTFLAPLELAAGKVALVSHSGATCAALLDWAQAEGWGFSRMISLGNQADLSESDALDSLLHDANTRAVALYLEGVKDGQEFLRSARSLALEKAVVATKVGSSDAGRQAAKSHTGALAGSDQAFEAAFRRCGVQRSRDLEQMLDACRALAMPCLPKGPRVAILTNAGGPAVMAADELEKAQLKLARPEAGTLARLQGFLPPAAGVANPVDMLASAGPEEHARCAATLLADAGVDMLLVVIVPPPMFDVAGVAEQLAAVLTRSAKPCVVCLMGGGQAKRARQVLRAANVLEYPFPARAVSALGALWQRKCWLEKAEDQPVECLRFGREQVARLLASPSPSLAGVQLGDQLLDAMGVRRPASALARDASEALRAAEKVGYPVALKAQSPNLVHKSDVGGVLLDVADPSQLRPAYKALVTEVRRRLEPERLEGVLVQHMVAGGQELIVGAIRDPQFGPLLALGSGGKEVEGLGDVAFALAPLCRNEAQDLLLQTWAGRKLAGYRDQPAGDREAVLAALAAVGRLMLEFPQIREFEINPLIVGREGEGAYAVDVRLQLAGESQPEVAGNT